MRTSGRRFPQLEESVSSASAPQLIFECGQRATSQQSNHTDLTSELPGGLLMIISRYESEPVLPSARVRCSESSLLADAEQLPALDPPLRVIPAATHLERHHAAQNRDEHELTAQRRPPLVSCGDRRRPSIHTPVHAPPDILWTSVEHRMVPSRNRRALSAPVARSTPARRLR